MRDETTVPEYRAHMRPRGGPRLDRPVMFALRAGKGLLNVVLRSASAPPKAVVMAARYHPVYNRRHPSSCPSVGPKGAAQTNMARYYGAGAVERCPSGNICPRSDARAPGSHLP